MIAVGVELPVEVVQHDARLDPCPPFLGVHLQELVHVLAEVEHQAGVHALTGKAGATAAGEDGDAVLGGDFDGGLHVVGVAWDNHADGLHLVDAGIGAVEDAREVVEPHIASNALLEFVLECCGIGVAGVW